MRCEDIYRIFSHLPTLETPRLVLRKMMVSDCFDMYDYARRPDLTKYLTWSPHGNVEYTKQYLAYLAKHYRLGDFYDWAVVLKSENKMIGTCGFTRFSFPNDAAEVGYVLNPDYHGKGIATEALLRVMTFGFEDLRLNRIEAKCIKGNVASRRVMEKVGMTFEGTRRGEMLIKGSYRDIEVSAVTREEFLRSGGNCKKNN